MTRTGEILTLDDRYWRVSVEAATLVHVDELLADGTTRRECTVLLTDPVRWPAGTPIDWQGAWDIALAEAMGQRIEEHLDGVRRRP